MSRKRALRLIGLLAILSLILYIAISQWRDRRYNLISVIVVLAATVPYYYAYEKKEGSVRRMVIIAVMVALAIIGRFVFAPIPGFQPVAAMVIISAVYMGSEAGFLVGSLSALVSNMVMGQGPWTPFQMIAWGLVGVIAGIKPVSNFIKTRVGMTVYGILSGILYSAFMDIWTVLSYDGTFSWARYLAHQSAALYFTAVYALSNVVFLWLGMGPIGRKLERISIKHGIFIGE